MKKTIDTDVITDEMLYAGIAAAEKCTDAGATDLTDVIYNAIFAALEVASAVDQAQSGWLRAIDEALVMHDVGVANTDDDYATAKDKLNKLLCVFQDIGAYFAKQESAQSELLEVVIAMRDWIDAVPHDLQLPTMPGFDRDWADAVIADAQKGKQAQSVAESVSKEWDSLGSIGNRLHNISVEQHYAGNEKLSDELGEFASLLWIWERTRKPTVPPAIPADLRSKVLELCETIIDAEDCGALVDDVMDFNLPRQIREMMGEA